MTEQELREQMGRILTRFEGTAFYPYSSSVVEALSAEILSLIKEANYVKLADDQSLPDTDGVNNLHKSGMIEAQQDMLRADFRKVEGS